MKNLLSLLFIGFAIAFSNSFVGQETTAQSGDFETGSTWISGSAPNLVSGYKLTTDVTVASGHEVTLSGPLTVNSGTVLTIEGDLTVSGLVDFQNGCTVLVTATGTLTMQNGENSNNSTDVTIEGSLVCSGNFDAGNGSDMTGTGTVNIYGDASGNGSIFGNDVDCAACSFTSAGQDVIPTYQIGGNDTYVGIGVPVEPYYGYTYSQSIYTAAELSAAGLTAGSKIISLVYQYTGTDLSNTNDWDVYIGHTSKSSFSDNNDWEVNGTLRVFATNLSPTVNTATSPTEVTVMNNVDPFEWDGSSNIVIAVDENSSGYDSSTDDFLCHTTSGNLSNRNVSDYTNQDPNSPPGGYARAYRPNLELLVTDIGCNASIPFSQDFDGGLLWEASGPSSSATWFVNSSTTSSGTGPASASVFSNSSTQFAYCETSGQSNGIYTLTSTCFDLTSVAKPVIRFEYHAFGATIGTLNLEYSLNGNTWAPLWSVTGQQHSSDSEAATAIEIEAPQIANYEGAYLRFYYTAGSSYTGDIAIDNFVLDQSNSWLGNSSDWFDAANWSTGAVPTGSTDAFISADATVTNVPTIDGSNGNVRDIEIESGGRMEIVGSTLNVYGNWTNNGTLAMGNSLGKIDFQGSSANTLNGGVQNIQNLAVSNSAGIVLESGTYNVYGTLYPPTTGSITTNDNLVIASNSTATGRIFTMPVQCSTPKTYYVLMQDSYGDGWNSATLDVYIDGVATYNMPGPSGSSTSTTLDVECGSVITFGWTSGSWDNEVTWKVYEDNASGTLLHTQTFSTQSGNSSSNLFEESAGVQTFVGDVIVQQHVTTAVNGWREFTSAVQNMTLSDFHDDGLYMSGFTGASSTYPSWTSVYTYDETQANGNKDNGWVPATNITNSLAPSAATRIYTGTGSYNLEMKGVPGAGEYAFNVSYQNSSSAEIAAAEDEKGWNFIGNPYPCPISWDAVSKVNIDDQIWIYSAESGNYGIYVGGAGSGTGTNNVDREIAANQGVWVHATSSGASVTITEAAKVDASADFVKSNEPMPFFKIGLTNNSNNYKDEVILGQDPSATLGLDPGKDGYKIFTSVSSAPSLWMMADTTPLSLNKVAVDQDFEIDLHYNSAVIGTHKLLFTNPDVMNFDGCLVLEDMELNTYTPITDSLEYSFNSNPITASGVRFKLHYYPTSDVAATPIGCHGSIDGTIAVDFGGIPPYSVTLTSASTSTTTIFNDSVGVFENLVAGMYDLEIGGGKGCANEEFQVEIVEPTEIMISKDVTNVTSAASCDGALRLDASGGVAPYRFYVNGIEGAIFDSLCIGNHDVVVVDANGCSNMTSVEIQGSATAVNELANDEFSVYPNPSNGNFTVFSKGQTHLRVYSVTGQIVKDLKFSNSKAVDMTGFESGVYILRDMESGEMTEIVLM